MEIHAMSKLIFPALIALIPLLAIEYYGNREPVCDTIHYRQRAWPQHIVVCDTGIAYDSGYAHLDSVFTERHIRPMIDSLKQKVEGE